MRKLILALFLVLSLTPMYASALGLGAIELQSGLNQALNAQIALLSVRADELSDIRVNLAPSDAFTRAGVERSFFLTQLKFEPEVDAQGQTVVTVTTRDAVKEPFLNFLVEVNWPQGRFLREYTVLLDPPVTFDEPEAPQISAPEKSVGGTGTIIKAAPVTRIQVADTSQAASAAKDYKTRRGDTLGAIAKRFKGRSTSLKQVMIGIFAANPNAFVDNNINKLKSGQILRIPTNEELAAISQEAAIQAFSRQTTAWREEQKKAKQAEPDFAVQTEAQRPVIESRDAPQQDVFKIDTPTSEEGGKGSDLPGESADAEVAELRRNFRLANEAVASQERENEELRSRVGNLSEQVNKLQRLFSLQSDELAALQQRLVEQGVDLPPEVQQELDAALAQAETVAVVDDPTATIQIDIDNTVTEDTDEVATVEEDIEQEAVEATSGVMAGLMRKADGLLDNPITLGGIALALVVCIVLIFLFLRRRRQAKAEEEALLMSGAGVAETVITSSQPAESDVRDETYPVADEMSQELQDLSEITDDESFLREVSAKEFSVDHDTEESLDSDVDPLAEADVYLAYGRYDQAEDLIEQAISEDPSRADYKVKLLEVYHATKDQAKFDPLATDIHAQIGQNDPLWGSVQTMGSDLNPSNPLYSSTTATAADDSMSAVSELDSGDDFLTDLPEPSDATTSDSDDLDFKDLDLDLGGTPPQAQEASQDDLAAELGDLTAELDALSPDLGTDLSDIGTFNLDDGGEIGGDLDLGSDLSTESDFTTDDLKVDLSTDEPLATASQSDDLDIAVDTTDFADFDAEQEYSVDADAFDAPTAQQNPTLEVDLGALDGILATDEQESQEVALNVDDLPSSDALLETHTALDIDLSGVGDLSASLNENALGDADDISFDLADPIADQKETPEIDISLDNNLGFDLDQADIGQEAFNIQDIDLGGGDPEFAAEPEVIPPETQVADIGDEPNRSEEIETKLELARVYVDMGDPDGAQDILKEVIEEGNAEQKQLAQDIISGM